MKRLRHALAVCACVSLVNTAVGIETATNDALRATLELSDGSRVIGIPTMTAIAVRTSYAKLNIQFNQIRNMKMENDHETASLEMINGDRLQGVYNMGPMEMETGFGKVKVDIRHITSMLVHQHADDALLSGLSGSLVLRYSFDQDRGRLIRDDTGKTGEGNVVGAKWTPDGKVGGAYEFDGTRSFAITPTVDSTGDMTWSVWIYPHSFPFVNDTFAQFLGARGHAWVWNSDNTSLSFGCQNAYGGSRLALQFCVQGTERTAGSTHHVFQTLPDANRWYHVAGVLDSSGTHLYMDGKLLSESTDKIQLAAPCSLIIGANDSGPQRYFDGLIDEVMVFKKALSGEEIRMLCESQR